MYVSDCGPTDSERESEKEEETEREIWTFRQRQNQELRDKKPNKLFSELLAKGNECHISSLNFVCGWWISIKFQPCKKIVWKSL